MDYVYQEYPKWLFHPILAPKGQIFQFAEDVAGLAEQGWVTTPAQFLQASELGSLQTVVKPLHAEKPTTREVSPSRMVHASLAEISEQKLVRQLLAHPLNRSMLLGGVGFPKDVHVFLEILLDKALGACEGDIDLLVCAPGRPDAAIAIQVKRVKVGANAFRNETPNKLKGIQKGVW